MGRLKTSMRSHTLLVYDKKRKMSIGGMKKNIEKDVKNLCVFAKKAKSIIIYQKY